MDNPACNGNCRDGLRSSPLRSGLRWRCRPSGIFSVWGFGYHNQNLGFIKDTKITERLNFQFRAEFFNIWNCHTFTSPGRKRPGRRILSDRY